MSLQTWLLRLTDYLSLVTTGEEEEETIHQVRGKLYALEESAWKEKGTGLLKLNVRASDGAGARLGEFNCSSVLCIILTLFCSDAQGSGVCGSAERNSFPRDALCSCSRSSIHEIQRNRGGCHYALQSAGMYVVVPQTTLCLLSHNL